jgi:hypothetical protein
LLFLRPYPKRVQTYRHRLNSWRIAADDLGGQKTAGQIHGKQLAPVDEKIRRMPGNARPGTLNLITDAVVRLAENQLLIKSAGSALEPAS